MAIAAALQQSVLVDSIVRDIPAPDAEACVDISSPPMILTLWHFTGITLFILIAGATIFLQYA